MGIGFGESCRVGELWVGERDEQGEAQIRSNLEWGFSSESGWAFLLMERLVKMVDRFWSVAREEEVLFGSVSLVEGLVGMESVVGGGEVSSTVVVVVGMGWAS